jgi:hypothetical protein
MFFFKIYDFLSQNNKITNIPHKLIFVSMLVILVFFPGCAGLKPSPLNQAAWDNDVEKIKNLVDSGALVDEVAPCPRKVFKVFASSPLDLAVLQGNFEAVKELIDSGADVNLSRPCHAITSSPEEFPRTPSQGYYAFKGSALMLSSLTGNLEITKLLLEYGADVNQLTEKGLWGFSELNEFDALSFSAEFGHSDITRLLLKYGADPSTSSYRALDRGRLNYLILLLEENALKVETDPEYMHYNAELAHLAADFYTQTEEEKALQFYKQAIELYPGATKNYESIADGKWLKEIGKEMFAIAATSFNKYAGSQGVTTSGSFVVSDFYIYRKYNYDPNWTEEQYFREKAKQSERNRTKCQEIVACYEENQPGVTLADCVEETIKKEGEKLSTISPKKL